MIKYKLWNRRVKRNIIKPDVVEIIFYDENYQNKGTIHTTIDYANNIPAEYKAPMDIYFATNGTMGR